MPSFKTLLSLSLSIPFFPLVSAQLATLAECESIGLSACWCSCSVPTVNAYCLIGSSAAQAEQCACTNSAAWSALLTCVNQAGCTNVAAYEQQNAVACAKLGYSLATPAATTVAQNTVQNTVGGTSTTVGTVPANSGISQTVTNTVTQIVGSSGTAAAATTTTKVTASSGADYHKPSVGVLTFALGCIAVIGYVSGSSLLMHGI